MRVPRAVRRCPTSPTRTEGEEMVRKGFPGSPPRALTGGSRATARLLLFYSGSATPAKCVDSPAAPIGQLGARSNHIGEQAAPSRPYTKRSRSVREWSRRLVGTAHLYLPCGTRAPVGRLGRALGLFSGPTLQDLQEGLRFQRRHTLRDRSVYGSLCAETDVQRQR